jgi:hypothetical protein
MSVIEEEDLVYIGDEILENSEFSTYPGGSCFVITTGLEYLTLKYTLKSLGYECTKLDRILTNPIQTIRTSDYCQGGVTTNYPFSKLVKSEKLRKTKN